MQKHASSDIYIGLMSGTSLDGIDVAIADFAQYPPKIIYQSTELYDKQLKQSIHNITHDKMANIDALCRLDIELGRAYADTVNRSLVRAALDARQIAAIGCHGQTIRHCPNAEIPYTLQSGDPNTLAAKTGITTVADFRRKDIALGGQGAPLAPAFHQFMFHSDIHNRAIVNIGGIANITHLPRGAEHPVSGFDTGPGNTLLDYWVGLHCNQSYDKSGNWAASGRIIDTLLTDILEREPYFKLSAPKSTGTDYFDSNWLQAFLSRDDTPVDVQATLVELTAKSIALGIEQLPASIEECFVCGGGAHNEHLIHRLQQALPGSQICSTEQLGMNPDYVEAIAFAWLARQTVHNRHGNLPAVTLASNETVLAGIYSGE